MQKAPLTKQTKQSQSLKKVQLGVLGKPLSGYNQMNFDYSDSKSFIAYYESQRRRDEEQLEKKNIFKVFDNSIKENSSKDEYFKQKSKQMKERTLKHNLYYIDQQIIQKELSELSLTNTRAEFDKKTTNQLDEFQIAKHILATQFVQSFNDQSRGQITKQQQPQTQQQQYLINQQQNQDLNQKNALLRQEQQSKIGVGDALVNQSQTFNRKEIHLQKIKSKNNSQKVDENQEYQQIQQQEQNQALFQIKRKVTNQQMNNPKSEIQMKFQQQDRIRSPNSQNQSGVTVNSDFKYLKIQKQVTFGSPAQQVIPLKHSQSSLEVGPTTQKFKQNSTHQKVNTQIFQSSEIAKEQSRKQSLSVINTINKSIDNTDKPFQEEEQPLETNEFYDQNKQIKENKQGQNSYENSQVANFLQNLNEQIRDQDKINKVEVLNSNEAKNDLSIQQKTNSLNIQNQQNAKKASEQTQSTKKISQKKQQRVEEKKVTILSNTNKKQSNSYNRNFILPNNFIIILDKGFSLFTYHFSEKFMSEFIFTFLNTFDCLSLRLVNKELYRRVNKVLFLRSQRQELIIEKKILKSAYSSQISDFIDNQIQDFVQIIESFEEIQDSEYVEFMQMVIPPQSLLVVLHIFLCIFGKQIVGIQSLLDNKAQWKKIMTVCFAKGSAKGYIQKLLQKANLEQLHELLPQKVYEQVRESISEHDSILSQLNSEKQPFLFKLFMFVEKIMDLYEIMCLKYPNVIKFIELLKKIKNEPEIRILSKMDDNFCNQIEVI